jgi:heme-degrading monooxygenase HmoA
VSIVKINAIHVPEGAGSELESRFAARKHSVDGAPGFEGFQLLRPVAGESRYFVVTTWADEESFRAWSETGAKAAHAGPPAGGSPEAAAGGAEAPRRPVASGADLLEFEVVDL